MPEQRDAAFYESGRATAPPGVCYTSLAGSTSEGYSQSVASTPNSTDLADQNQLVLPESPVYISNCTNFAQQTPQASPRYTPGYSPCQSPSLNYPLTVSKNNSAANLPFQSPDYSPNYSASHTYLSNFPTSTFSNFNNSNIVANNNNNQNNNFELPSTSKHSHKGQYLVQEGFLPPEQSSTLFNHTKVSKVNSAQTNFYFLNSQAKYIQGKEGGDGCSEKKPKKDFEVIQRAAKATKDDGEFSHNLGELQQLFSKHGTKIKSTQDANQELLTDSFLQFIQKKNQERNPQDNFSYDLGDISQILVSLTSKLKSDDGPGLKKKDNNEDPKLMNDFLTKILLEKEEKRFKSSPSTLFSSSDDKKKTGGVRREIFDELGNEFDEKRTKRDAMSHYQEDKSHHKRPPNYGDFNQWDYLSQQDIQTSNNHNRRGHFPFGGASQSHSMGWNPMGMTVPRQTNPYYSNPHGHVVPAHAHSEYRYNQWNNPNHKNVPNIHNAHSQNTVLPQGKLHGDVPNPVQDYGLTPNPVSDASKLRNPPLQRAPPPSTEKSVRATLHSDHLATPTPAIRNTAIRASVIPNHSKTVINNPLSDLQLLVTNQESENPPQKSDNYQQESVDLSAHSEVSKQKPNAVRDEDKSAKNNSEERKDFSSPISVIQKKNKSDVNELEKPVELISKNNERCAESDISSSVSVNNLESKNSNSFKVAENNQKEIEKGTKGIEEPVKTSVIVEKDADGSANRNKSDELIPKNANNDNSEIPDKTSEKNGEASLENSKNSNDSQEANEQETDISKENNTEERDVQKSNQGLPDRKVNESVISSKRKLSEEEEEDRDGKKAFLEVESQLEKMFEGIVEESPDLPTVSSTSTEVKSTQSGSNKKSPKKKPSQKSRAARLSSGQSSSSESHFSSKKPKNSLGKDVSKKKIKKTLCDVAERRGPVLHVEGTKESPSSVTVINFPKGDDEDEKDKSFSKKLVSNAVRAKHHNELDYRGRSRNGLFSSTLSARYDAHTTDHTWICVFCKKGPHYNTLGDLFGPYIISKDENTSLCDFSGDEKDISDAQKRGGRNKKSLRSNNMVEHFQKMSRKLRRTQSNDTCLTGMTVISDDQVDQLRYEVWVHEQCAVWSPNVCLIGSRIIGMQEAIWSSVKTMCSKCGVFGANIGCVYRNCPNRCHYYCAKDAGWSLEQETFISTCHIHKPRS